MIYRFTVARKCILLEYRNKWDTQQETHPQERYRNFYTKTPLQANMYQELLTSWDKIWSQNYKSFFDPQKTPKKTWELQYTPVTKLRGRKGFWPSRYQLNKYFSRFTQFAEVDDTIINVHNSIQTSLVKAKLTRNYQVMNVHQLISNQK